MNTDLDRLLVSERLDSARREAQLRHLLRNRPAGANLWARLLPPLRRLEAWLERHARQQGTRRVVVRR